MDVTTFKKKRHEECFQFGPWTLTASESHILISEGPDREAFESQLQLPQLPEMVFADNMLRVCHAEGFGIEFNALDALKLVDAECDSLKVAVAQAWQQARGECEHIKDVVRPFDWTYTTPYAGTLIGEGENRLHVEETTEHIDMERLKVREKIHFFGDIMLYEDELADHGRSVISIKVRVMPTSLFALMRFYLRVDDVMVRVNDTRIYLQADKDYIIREYSSREAQIKDLKVPLHILTDANSLPPHLPIKFEKTEKLRFPPGVATSEAEISTTATLV